MASGNSSVTPSPATAGANISSSTSTATKTIPKDAEVMIAILKDMGVTDYEPRLVNQMLEFTYRYITDVLEDSQAYSNHAGRLEIDTEDVKLAIQCRLDHSFTTPPPREFLMEIARQKNSTPLPVIKPHNGPRLPPDRYCLSSTNYRLKPQHKRATLTMPSRLTINSGLAMSASAGTKLSPGFTLSSKQPYLNLTSRTPPLSVSLGGHKPSQPLSIIKTVTRTSLPSMQPGTVISRTLSSSSSVISTPVTSIITSTQQTTLKRKHDEDNNDD